ncbi:hypothetical protein [Variovorax sp. UMC13]|nr:hypothetical protein [Variovorax sp. UMC13]
MRGLVDGQAVGQEGQRFDTSVMRMVIASLILLVTLVQFVGGWRGG